MVLAYLLYLTFALCVLYFILHKLFPLFFNQRQVPLTKKSFNSIFYLVLVSLASYALSYSISDPYLSNRALHIFGGGVTASFLCYRVVRDTKLKLTAFQFFFFSLLIVTALGVANEIFEFFLQNYFNFISSTSINDTWLDLISNTIGIFIASAIFVPLFKKHSKPH